MKYVKFNYGEKVMYGEVKYFSYIETKDFWFGIKSASYPHYLGIANEADGAEITEVSEEEYLSSFILDS